MATISPQEFQKALTALGVSTNDFDTIRRLPHTKVQEFLQELKTKARKNYKKMAFELHPDRTQGDKAKTEQFNLLGQVLEKIEELTVHPPVAPQIVQFIPIVTWQQQRFNPNRPINTTTYTKTQVFRIVNMKPK